MSSLEHSRLKLVVKSNKLVEAKYRLTVMEQKLIIMAISKIDPTKPNFENPYALEVKEVAEALGIEGENLYSRVAATVDKLMTRLVKLKEDDGHTVVHWVSKARYYTGTGNFELWFHEDMKSYLLNLQEYLKYEAPRVLQLQSTYSIRIYEILKKWQGADQTKGKDGHYYLTQKVDQLRETLGVRSTQYKLYADFKRHVILKAQKELKIQTDISFDFNEIKKGRKVEGITFIIKNNIPSSEPKKKRGRPKKNKSTQEVHLEENPSIGELLNESYSENITEELHSKGIIHHDKYKREGIQEEHWKQAINEVGNEAKAGLVVSSAKKHRDIGQTNNKPVEPDYSKENKAYWEENISIYNSDLLPSTAYIQIKSGGFIHWNEQDFIEKLKPFIKSFDIEDKRESNIYILTVKHWTSGQRPAMIISKIRQAQEDGLYTKWSTDSMRKNKTNPEYIKNFMIGRASKENEGLLTSIFKDIYGDNWENESKERLSKKGIDIPR